jgi:hypothetical protein
LTTDTHDAILARAEQLLGAAWGREVALAEPALLGDRGRNLVLRCRVYPDSPAGDTLVVKWRRPDAPARLLQTEWASLALLAELPEAAGAAPLLYAGDPVEGLLVLEDLGLGGSLEDALQGRDPARLDALLADMGRCMARLQRATLGREPDFVRRCAVLPGFDPQARKAEATHWRATTRQLAWFAVLGSEPPSGFEIALERIAADYAEPDGLLAFSHGDPAPSNNRAAGGGLRLIDFEYGAFRHLFYDLSAWAMLCPLPEPQLQLLRGAFLRELGDACPALLDPPALRDAWATMCTYRGLAVLSWLPLSTLQTDRPWVGAWSARAAALCVCARLREQAAATPALAPVAEAADALERHLRACWPEQPADTRPPWPVFAG